MKKILFISIYCITSTIGYAQIQTGLVREINSGKKPVGSVQVTFDGAVPTVSDDNGIFRLAFSGKRPGDFISLNEIRKTGYELVNGKDLEVLKLSNTDKLGEDIIVAKRGVIDAAKKEYYEVSDKALLASFNREKTALQNKLKKAELGEKEYELQLTNLQEEFDRQQKKLDEVAEKFARVNFDDIDSLYKTALHLYKFGDIDGSIIKLEEANLIKRAEKIISLETKVTKEKKETIESLMLQAELYSLKFRIDKAVQLFDKLITLDSNNLSILEKAGNFYAEQHIYSKAKFIFNKILLHPGSSSWLNATANESLGKIYENEGNLSMSLIYFEKVKSNCKRLLEEDNLLLRNNLLAGNTLHNIGLIYRAFGNTDSAIHYFKECYKYQKKIHSIAIENIMTTSTYAIAAQLLGNAYFENGQLDSAFKYFIQFNVLAEKICTLENFNGKFSKALPTSLRLLGVLYKRKGLYKEALQSFVASYNVAKVAYKKQSANNELKEIFGATCEAIGTFYLEKGNADSAMVYCQEYKTIADEISNIYPLAIKFKKRTAIAYQLICQINQAKGNLDSALIYIKTCIKILKKIIEESPEENLSNQNDLAIAYQHLGIIYKEKGKWNDAIEAFTLYNSIAQTLLSKFYDNPEYKENVAISLQHLGKIHEQKGDITQALVSYTRYYQLENELHKIYPNNQTYLKSLAIASQLLGDIYNSQGNLEKALQFYTDFNNIAKLLCSNTPHSEAYKKLYGISEQYLGILNLQNKNFDSALSHFTQFNNILCSLPQSRETKFTLSISHQYLGHTFFQKRMLDSALIHYKAFNTVANELNSLFPENDVIINSLAVSLEKLGDIFEFHQDFDTTVIFYKQSFQLNKSAYDKNNDNSSYLNCMIICSDKLSSLLLKLKKYHEALYYSEKSTELKTIGEKKFPKINPNWRKEISKSYGNLSYCFLFNKKFTEAERYALIGLSTDSTQTWIYTNLAIAYLYQGKWEQAKEIYLRLKDLVNGGESFKVAFIQDLKDFEAAGITHPDMAKARALLEEK